MKIIDNTSITVEFSSLKTGDCFIYDNCLFIKIDPTKESSPYACNAFCFVDNKLTSVPLDWSVIPVDADITIRNKGVG